jgi:hypothetical protein
MDSSLGEVGINAMGEKAWQGYLFIASHARRPKHNSSPTSQTAGNFVNLEVLSTITLTKVMLVHYHAWLRQCVMPSLFLTLSCHELLCIVVCWVKGPSLGGLGDWCEIRFKITV